MKLTRRQLRTFEALTVDDLRHLERQAGLLLRIRSHQSRRRRVPPSRRAARSLVLVHPRRVSLEESD